MRAGLPVRWTGIIALVAGVIACSILSGSIFISSLISTKTGLAPVNAIEEAEAINELGTVMTSSPSLTPIAFKTRYREEVPFATPIPYFALQKAANFFSNSDTLGPRI